MQEPQAPRVILITVVMIVTLALSACAAPAADGGDTASAAPAAKGGDLVIAFPASSEPASLDGHIDPYQPAWLFDSFVSDPLVILDNNGDYQPGPGHQLVLER